MDPTPHLRHTLEQVLRFSAMLGGSRDPDRPPEVLYAQLGFNLGRYSELAPNLAPGESRTLWQQYEACIHSQNWEPLQQWAQAQLNPLP